MGLRAYNLSCLELNPKRQKERDEKKNFTSSIECGKKINKERFRSSKTDAIKIIRSSMISSEAIKQVQKHRDNK